MLKCGGKGNVEKGVRVWRRAGGCEKGCGKVCWSEGGEERCGEVGGGESCGVCGTGVASVLGCGAR